MSEKEEKEFEISQEELDKLPKDTVHCFPASKSQILKRRIITLAIATLDCAAVGYLLVGKTQPSPLLWGVFGAILVICLVVFIHTFVIAKYRVALDYKNKEVALRYMFSKITIPFDSFDARDGEADRAMQLLQNSTLGANMERVHYLVLDNVYEEVCYQTSSKDLASQEDFDLLAKEAKQIASVFKAKEQYDALKPDGDKDAEEQSSADDLTSLVKGVIKEDKNDKASKANQAVAEAKEAIAEETEAVSDAVTSSSSEEKSEE